MKLIDRKRYSEKILNYLGKGDILVLVGQRRVGKSCILKCVKDRIEENHPNANVIYISKEWSDFDSIHTYTDLNAYVESRLIAGKENYLFIDEVQDIECFEKSLRSFQAKGQCEIVVTGSNAKMLSSELSTLIGGRYIEIHIYSLNYEEFLQFHQIPDSNDAVYKYLSYGGLPHLAFIGLDNMEMVMDYLRDIYNTIMLKDVIERERIRNVRFLGNLAKFISDNIGKNISASAISKYMRGQRLDVSTAMIINYLSYFKNAYIVNEVNRFDLRGKKLFDTNEKYYFEDLGLRNVLVGVNLRRYIEKLMENVVYLKLIQSGFKVTVGQLQNGEIDFVAEKNGRSIYIQVTYLISSQEVEDREFGNLKAIPDNYPKMVVSLDPLAGQGDVDGIQNIHLRKFLLGDAQSL